jgi:hypothetical protein
MPLLHFYTDAAAAAGADGAASLSLAQHPLLQQLTLYAVPLALHVHTNSCTKSL